MLSELLRRVQKGSAQKDDQVLKTEVRLEKSINDIDYFRQ